jgi:membrane protease YdiL (CAAX protease family)
MGKPTPGGFLLSDAFFVAIAIVLNYFVVHANLIDLYTKPWGLGQQLLFGIVVGAAISCAVVLYLPRTHVLDSEVLVSSFSQLAASPYWLLLTAGFTAGFAEEFLMRGTIQVIAGIWITSILFMLMHAPYWGSRPHTVGKGIFAVFVLILGIAAGYTFIAIGLIAVSVVHSAVDMSFFVTIKRHLSMQHQPPMAASG